MLYQITIHDYHHALLLGHKASVDDHMPSFQTTPCIMYNLKAQHDEPIQVYGLIAF